MFGKSTENLGLPQWQPKDHPDFLTDINNAFKDIDSAYGTTSTSLDLVKKQIEEITETNNSHDTLLNTHTEEISNIKDSIEGLDGISETIERIIETNTEQSESITEINDSITTLTNTLNLVKSKFKQYTGVQASITNLSLSPGMHTIKIDLYNGEEIAERRLVHEYLSVRTGDYEYSPNILVTPYTRNTDSFGLGAIKLDCHTSTSSISVLVMTYIAINSNFLPSDNLIIKLELIE